MRFLARIFGWHNYDPLPMATPNIRPGFRIYRRQVYIAAVVLLVYVCGLIVHSFCTPNSERGHERKAQMPMSKRQPVILGWTKFFGSYPYPNTIGRPKTEPRALCEFTDDRQRLDEADVVVFHSRDMDDLPPDDQRNPNATYLFWALESLPHSNVAHYRFPTDYFNRTMTTAPDSDIPCCFPPNVLRSDRPDARPMLPPPPGFFEKKQEGVFALISNCANTPNGRADVLTELNKAYPVAMRGGCAENQADRDFCVRGKPCIDKIREAIEGHFFYSAIENSDCYGYITEKTYDRIEFNSIPIVMRRDIYEKNPSMPPSSQIFVDDFESSEEMAVFLRSLQSNKTAYMSYFKYRERYGVDEKFNVYWDALCAQLNDPNSTLRNSKKTIPGDVSETYMKCLTPHSFES